MQESSHSFKFVAAGGQENSRLLWLSAQILVPCQLRVGDGVQRSFQHTTCPSPRIKHGAEEIH